MRFLNIDTPFGLTQSVTWLLGILVPSIITVLGWLYVHLSNKKMIKIEKQSVIKMRAYENIQENFYHTSLSFANLNSLLFLTIDNLKRLDGLPKPLYTITKESIIEEFKNQKFKELRERCSEDFSEMIFRWEQYEIVFLKFLDQRVALQEEFSEIMREAISAISDYDNYFYHFSSGVDDKDQRKALVMRLDELYNKAFDFIGCLYDVRCNIQNFVFGDMLTENIGKRQVKDKSFLTIDSLLEKHKDVIELGKSQRK